MSSFEFVFRIILALLCPPLGVLGLKDIGCGTFLLLCLLSMMFWLPGQIVAIYFIVKAHDSELNSK